MSPRKAISWSTEGTSLQSSGGAIRWPPSSRAALACSPARSSDSSTARLASTTSATRGSAVRQPRRLASARRSGSRPNPRATQPSPAHQPVRRGSRSAHGPPWPHRGQAPHAAASPSRSQFKRTDRSHVNLRKGADNAALRLVRTSLDQGQAGPDAFLSIPAVGLRDEGSRAGRWDRLRVHGSGGRSPRRPRRLGRPAARGEGA